MELGARFDRALVRTRFTSNRYLMLEITAPTRQERRPRQPLNLGIVLDRSGSMAGAKLALAREAAAMLVRQLDERDRACVIAYDDDVRVVAPSRLMTPEARSELDRLIRGVHSGGSTNLSGGWLEGCRQIAEQQVVGGAAGTIDRALLLTDGLANVGIVDQEELCTHAAELRARGVSTTTFGLGDDYNEDLLQAMADKGGGHYFYLRGAGDLEPSFRQELGELLELTARDIVVEVRASAPGARIELLNEYVVEPIPSGVRVRVGDLASREQKTLIVKVTTAPAEIETRVDVDAVLMYREPDGERGRELSFPTVGVQHAPDHAVDAQPRDPKVTRQVGLLYAARAEKEAAIHNRDGQFPQAQRVLEQTAKRIASYAGDDPELHETVQRLQDRTAEAAVPMSAPMAKEMTYASYRTTTGRRDYR